MEYVYLDTSIFEANNFFEGAKIKSFMRLNDEGHIKIVLPQLTIDEILSRLHSNVKNASAGLTHFRDKTRVLRNINSFKDLINFKSENEYLEIFKKLLEVELTSDRIEILEYPTVNIQGIFQKYFNQTPPFGEGKKKNEFPDAFALMTIEIWCEQNDKKCNILSTDKDIKNYNNNKYFIIHQDYNKYLDRKLREYGEFHAERTMRMEKLIENERENLRDEILNWTRENLRDKETYISDFNQKILQIKLNKISADFDDYNIVGIDDYTIYVEAKPVINYSVEIELEEFHSASFDKETETWNRFTTKKKKKINQQETIIWDLYADTPQNNQELNELGIDDINRGMKLKITIGNNVYTK